MQKLEEIIIELSYNCNLSCSMCGFGKHVNPFHKNKFLSLETYKTILPQVGNKTRTVRLNGRGESTIHPDFVEILDYTKRSFPNISINLFSNMSFKNQKILNSLLTNEVQLFISMDSPVEEELVFIRRGAKYNHIERNIKELKVARQRPFIIFTIQEANIHRILDIAEFALKNNCHILYNTIRRDEGIEGFVNQVNDNLESIIEQFEKVNFAYQNSDLLCLYPDQLAGIQLNTSESTQTHGTMRSCPALESEICILYDGTVTPCNMFNPYIYGNAFKQSMDEIWNGKPRLDFLNTHKHHYYCKNCANLGK